MDESYHSLLAAGIEKKYRQLEQDIMDDIVRRIRKAGTITDSADWQIQRLIILGNSTQDIENLIRKAVDGNEAEVRRLYAEVIDREYTRDRGLYEQVGKEFIPYEQNPELQQITNALVDQSSEELYNITKSMGFMIDNGHGGKVFTPLADVYNGYLDQAITGMANGAYDYNTLIRRMVGQMTASGLRTDHAFSDGGNDYGIDYASGWHNRIDVAARRALLTGFGQLTGRVTDIFQSTLPAGGATGRPGLPPAAQRAEGSAERHQGTAAARAHSLPRLSEAVRRRRERGREAEEERGGRKA